MRNLKSFEISLVTGGHHDQSEPAKKEEEPIRVLDTVTTNGTSGAFGIAGAINNLADSLRAGCLITMTEQDSGGAGDFDGSARAMGFSTGVAGTGSVSGDLNEYEDRTTSAYFISEGCYADAAGTASIVGAINDK